MIFPDWLILQSGLALVLLLVAAYTDLKKHEVSNDIWLVLICGGAIIAVVSYGASAMLFVHFIFAGLIAAAALAVWYVGADFIGAADVKALIALGVCIPTMMLGIIGYAGVFGMAFVGYKFVRGTKPKDLLRIQVPFMPILFLALFAALFAYAFTVPPSAGNMF